MKIDVLADANSVARAAASMIAEKARSGVAARGRFIMAVSGGRTQPAGERDSFAVARAE
jgi:6-phosphogluconolactonase